MIKRIKLILQVLLFQLSSRSQGLPFEQLPHTNPLQSDTDSILHEQVKEFFRKSKAPGLLVGISRDGKRSYYSYGHADTATKKTMGPSTVFEIGSITKTFTANLLFQLDAAGTIHIDKPLSLYIPNVTPGDSVLGNIFLKEIASHTSGLPRLPANLDKVPGYTMMQPYAQYTRDDLFDYLRGLKKTGPHRYQYSNLGFGILSTILEKETNHSFEDLLEELIWKPLGMETTYLEPGKQQLDSATGYFYGKPAPYWNFKSMAGAGAIRSNATDMLNYLEAHIETRRDAIRKAIQKITTPISPAGTHTEVCYGWHTFEDLKHRVFWHNGGTYGFSSFAAFEPITRHSIVLFANASGVNAALDKLAVNLLILLMGE